MKQDSVGVSITTNGRCLPLLKFIIQEWLRRGAEVVVSTNKETAFALQDYCITLVVTDVSPEKHGDAMQDGFDRVRSPYVMTGADDRLPVGEGWMMGLPRIPGSIAAINLISVRGEHFYDWATYDKGVSWMQRLDDCSPNTYITGGAQLISPEVRSRISYRNRPFRTPGDVNYCLEAVAAGFKLIPPSPTTPLMIHLDPTAPPQITADRSL